MRHIALTLLFLCLPLLAARAQRVSHRFHDTSLSEALLALDKTSGNYTINFIYNELEDFRVTTNVQRQTLPDAVRQVVGLYPMRLTFDGSQIYVECIDKAPTKISGRVVDSHRQPISFATVSLLSPTDSTLLAGGVTNEGGQFVIPTGLSHVIMRVSCVGYKTVTHNLHTGNVGDVMLQPETFTVKGVTVKGQRPTYKMGREGLVTRVEGTALATAGSADNVIGLLPNVTGEQGQYTVFGKQGHPIIYINGRKMSNAQELQALKSDEIRQVEVITNPGARYDATVTSVIKLTTKKRGEGFGGYVEAQSWYNKEASNTLEGQLNYRHSGLDLSAYANIGDQNHIQKQEMTEDIPGLVHTTEQIRMHADIRPLNLMAQVNYDFGHDHSIGISYHYDRFKIIDKWNIDALSTPEGEETQQLTYDTYRRSPHSLTHNVDAYYNGHIGHWDIDFNLSYLYDRSAQYQHTAVTEDGRAAETVVSDNKDSHRLYASRLVLTHPLLGGSWEMGYEHTHTHAKTRYDRDEGVASHTNDRIDEQTLATYIDYGHAFGRFMTEAGLRLEHTRSDYYQHEVWSSGQSRHYTNLFPNIVIAYDYGGLRMQLGYSVKIRRPNYDQLSSNVQYDNRYLYEGGNPLLRSTHMHTLELGTSYRWLSFTAAYEHDKDPIMGTDERYTDNAIRNIDVNISHRTQLSLMLAASRKIGPWEANYSVGYSQRWFSEQELGLTEELHRPVWQLKLYNSIDLPWQLKLGVNYFVQTRGCYDNLVTSARSRLRVSLYRTFLHDHLSVRLEGDDLLRTYNDDYRYVGPNLNLLRRNYAYVRELMLTIRYSFNATRSKYKGTGAGQEEKSRL
jgi:hypothetical protein